MKGVDQWLFSLCYALISQSVLAGKEWALEAFRMVVK